VAIIGGGEKMKSAKRKIFFVLFMAILVTGLFAGKGHKREGIPLKTVALSRRGIGG
jgi:hypothetical protein